MTKQRSQMVWSSKAYKEGFAAGKAGREFPSRWSNMRRSSPVSCRRAEMGYDDGRRAALPEVDITGWDVVNGNSTVRLVRAAEKGVLTEINIDGHVFVLTAGAAHNLNNTLAAVVNAHEFDILTD